MNDLIGLSSLKYKSNAILERRRRILRETRNLIAETGYASFNIRDLCARADIAQKTLYNAFGGKDNVIASAVQEFIIEFNERTTFRFPGDTLDGVLEGTLRMQAENMRVAAYTRAIVAVFYASSGSEYVRRSIRETCNRWNTPFVTAIEEANGLAIGVSREWFSHMLISSSFSVTSDWCAGEIPDDEFLNRAAETLLIVVAGATRGKVNLQARRWLDDLRENRASWVSLRSLTGLDDAAAEPATPAAPEPARKAPAEKVARAARPRRAVSA